MIPSYILRPEDYHGQSLSYKPTFVEKYVYGTRAVRVLCSGVSEKGFERSLGSEQIVSIKV